MSSTREREPARVDYRIDPIVSNAFAEVQSDKEHGMSLLQGIKLYPQKKEGKKRMSKTTRVIYVCFTIFTLSPVWERGMRDGDMEG